MIIINSIDNNLHFKQEEIKLWELLDLFAVARMETKIKRKTIKEVMNHRENLFCLLSPHRSHPFKLLFIGWKMSKLKKYKNRRQLKLLLSLKIQRRNKMTNPSMLVRLLRTCILLLRLTNGKVLTL